MWGDKGEEYAPHKCEHEKGEGCMWCCQRCNYDTHMCGGCGTIVGHNETTCPDCKKYYSEEQVAIDADNIRLGTEQ